MNKNIDLPAELVEKLDADFRKGPIIDDNCRLLTEGTYGYIHSSIKVSTFSKENEPPHFRLDYQGTNCRYNLYTGEPIDKVPTEIKKYTKNIRKWYDQNREDLIDFYEKNLADDAPPQARVKR